MKMASKNSNESHTEKTPITGNYSSQPPPTYSAITSPSLGLGPSVGPVPDSVLSQGPEYQMRLAPPEIAQYSYPYPYPNVQNPPGTVVDQPQINVELRSDWMSIPAEIPNCRPGLEYLASLDRVIIQQTVEVLEIMTGFETNNKYIIKNSFGQNVYLAAEDNDCCTRYCCGDTRPFDMKVLDIYSNEIMHFYRRLACSSCCFPCCLQSLEVSSPPGQVVGHVKQEWTLCYNNFAIKNHLNETVLRIEGPCCTCSCCDDIDFRIVDLSGTEIGKISKKWSGFVQEAFTDADVFGISFPVDLDVRMKAVLIGACILIDMMFFEDNQSNQ